MAEEIINKVAASGLITIDLEDYYPKQAIAAFDIKPFLYMELILKEKEFRQQLKEYNWQAFENKYVAVYCSSDAIIPRWAYMLIATYLQPFAKEVYVGSATEVADILINENIANIDFLKYTDKRVVIKGCGDLNVSASAYLTITKKLLPLAQSIMYGEACSTVPVYKKKKPE